jgi:endonuclease-3
MGASKKKRPVKQAGKSAKKAGKKKAVKKKVAKKALIKTVKTSRPAPAKVRFILKGLATAYPDAECALRFTNPLELLVATILSAQCTDVRVNMVTEKLFKKYGKPADYAAAPPGELEEDIRSTGFFNNKAKSIRGATSVLDERFSGKVPNTMEELLTLPGVARKTANVVLGTAYGIPAGIVVDTHVSRISQRLGLTENKQPEKIEADLIELIPREEWIDFSHRLILHGRQVCAARKPDCNACNLARHCPSAGTF